MRHRHFHRLKLYADEIVNILKNFRDVRYSNTNLNRTIVMSSLKRYLWIEKYSDPRTKTGLNLYRKKKKR